MSSVLPKSGFPAPLPAPDRDVRVQLRILATSDLHMNLSDYDYHTDTPCVTRGLSLTASRIAEARGEVAGSLLLDNGDFLQGSPLGDYAARVGLRPHPMIRAMAHLGYDAVNLGNHEFSHGMPVLTAALKSAPFPVISANTHPRPDSGLAGMIRPWTILERMLLDAQQVPHRVRVGVIGALPQQTEVWDRQAINGAVRMTPMAEAVARHLPDLRAAGADVVVVLAHCGIGPSPDGNDKEEGALPLARLDGVDAIVMGHVHEVFPAAGCGAQPGVDPQAATLWGKPAVMPGFFGSHLGVIDLTLDRAGKGWTVVAHRAEARAIWARDAAGKAKALVRPDAVLTAQIAPVHDATRAWARRPVGRIGRAVHSFFGMVTDCFSVQIVNRAQMDYVAAKLAGGPYGHLPVLSASAPFRAGGRAGPENYTFVPPGPVLLRNVADLYIHPNTIMALRVTGAGLHRWLNCAARGYERVVPGQADQPLFGPEVPSFVYDTIAGLTYDIDLSAPSAQDGGQRIVNLCWRNEPIDPDQEFILATNSYRGSVCSDYGSDDKPHVVLDERITNRDILIAHLGRVLAEAQSPAAAAFAPAPPGWRFRAMPGTSVVFDTSPRAADYLHDFPDLALTPLGATEDGFLRMRLAL